MKLLFRGHRIYNSVRLDETNMMVTIFRGAPKGGRGARPPPLGPEKHCIFRVSSVKLRDLHL